jgi:hypothetical protein
VLQWGPAAHLGRPARRPPRAPHPPRRISWAEKPRERSSARGSAPPLEQRAGRLQLALHAPPRRSAAHARRPPPPSQTLRERCAWQPLQRWRPARLGVSTAIRGRAAGTRLHRLLRAAAASEGVLGCRDGCVCLVQLVQQGVASPLGGHLLLAQLKNGVVLDRLLRGAIQHCIPQHGRGGPGRTAARPRPRRAAGAAAAAGASAVTPPMSAAGKEGGVTSQLPGCVRGRSGVLTCESLLVAADVLQPGALKVVHWLRLACRRRSGWARLVRSGARRERN